MATIFHAFNMNYTTIGDLAPELVRTGFTHVQFPPIQKTRTLTELDGELLRKLVLKDKQLGAFTELFAKAQYKAHHHAGHTFDYLLRNRVFYINQPTLRAMHNAVLDNAPLNVESSIARAFIEIGDDKKHKWYPLCAAADLVLDGIDTFLHKEHELHACDAEIAEVRSRIERINTEVIECRKSRQCKDPILEVYKSEKANLLRLQSLRHKFTLAQELQACLKLTPDILTDVHLHTFDTKIKITKTLTPRIINRILFYEYILYPPWWLIYQPVQLAIGDTFLGTHDEISNAIRACKSAGLQVIVDVVINNLAATAGEKTDWLPIVTQGKYDNSPVVLRLQQLLLRAFGSDDLNLVTFPKECAAEQEPTECWMSLALPQLNQMHPLIISARDAFLNSLLDLGVDGVRIDAAAHLTPQICQAVVRRFPGLSYIEYLGNSGGSSKYAFSDYADVLRLEDFDIGESLFGDVFGPYAHLEKTKNYGHTSLKRYTNLDSVVMIINHDHVMGSIPSLIYTELPSKSTYDLALSYLLQRIYGHVLLMPHDISSDYVLQALDLRN